MKKIIVLVLLVLAIGASADSWLSIDMAFQAGWIPNGSIQIYDPATQFYSEPFDSVFLIDATAFGFIKLGGKTISFFNFMPQGESPINFIPTGITYQVYFGFEPIKGLSIYYEHSCTHPIVPYMPSTQGHLNLDAGYDRIYLEVKGHFDF